MKRKLGDNFDHSQATSRTPRALLAVGSGSDAAQIVSAFTAPVRSVCSSVSGSQLACRIWCTRPRGFSVGLLLTSISCLPRVQVSSLANRFAPSVTTALKICSSKKKRKEKKIIIIIKKKKPRNAAEWI